MENIKSNNKYYNSNKKQIQIAAGYLGPDDFEKVLEQVKQILK